MNVGAARGPLCQMEASGVNRKIHLTAWPLEPLPVVPVHTHDVEIIEGGDYLLLGRPAGEIQLPLEFYLREVSQLGDGPHELAEFTTRFGLLRGNVAPPRDYPTIEHAETRRAAISSKHNYREVVHLDEIRYRRRTIIAWTEHRRFFRDHPRRLPKIWREAGFSSTRTQPEAWQRFAGLLNMALSPLQPFVRAVIADRQTTDPSISPSSYTVAAIQLFNHIVEDATYRVCNNETCGRTYVRQINDAEPVWHRTRGTRYCSARCAEAQSSRLYRRRHQDQEE